jgi:hypothetical protein
LLCPPGKQKNLPSYRKNKTLPNHSPTDINVMIEIVEKNIHLSLDRKECQLETANELKQRVHASLDRKVVNLKFSFS